MPLVVLVGVLVVLHLLIALLLPMRWSAIRDEFHKHLEQRLQQELETAYLSARTRWSRPCRRNARRSRNWRPRRKK